jgi:DNA-directed RNA polymerase specialized sigma24 family protein
MVGRSDEGFDEFATTAWPRLRRIGYLLTGDHHLAEDLAQAALVRTYASWRRVRREDAAAYSRRVLLNLNVDRLRRRRLTERERRVVVLRHYFFASVPGDLAKVVAYDAQGEVVEDHRLKDCDRPVECEVR